MNGRLIEIFLIFFPPLLKAFLEAVMNLQFSMVETLWQQFWRTGQAYVKYHI